MSNPNRAPLPFLAALALRLTLAAGFLSAVADRFGLWGPAGAPGVAWGGFGPFLAYTHKLLWFLPAALVPAAGWTATVLEFALAVGLLTGIRLRAVAIASGILLAVFAAAMTMALGPEPALSYSVWSASAGAFLLASVTSASRKTKRLVDGNAGRAHGQPGQPENQ